MAKEAEMWVYREQQEGARAALATLTDYVRQAGSTLPVGNIDLVHGICDRLCQILRDDRNKFEELAMNVARRYAGEIYAGEINLTDILIRRDFSEPIDKPQRLEEAVMPSKIADSADLRGRLNRLCELYSLKMVVQNTKSA